MQIRRRIVSPRPPFYLPRSAYSITSVSRPYHHRSPAFCPPESDIDVSHRMTCQLRNSSYSISRRPSQPPLEPACVHGYSTSHCVVEDYTASLDVV
ncbi:hypothetical protein BDV33DRAFT_184481 [Aspergillus novoparasiticus]|uniref:Uncharacterized protein n=1 Tax=Aspergillus novoparasiticus TaxID=986946 RepID=A0A5N6E881_9EURO|nr:hypothetical protein BDV33DRAFT_184481 [Aspergillus novoparasiticus]